MSWYFYMAVFAAGCCAINCIPHLVAGVSGERFQSLFASPPGVGESPAVVNFLWGAANVGFCYGLILLVPDFDLADKLHLGVFSAGAVITGTGLSWHFGKVRHSKSR